MFSSYSAERYFTTVVHSGDAATGAATPQTAAAGPPPSALDTSPGGVSHPGAPHTPTKTQSS